MTLSEKEKLTTLNQALLDIDREVKEALYQGIKKRETLFRANDMLNKMATIQLSTESSQVELISDIRRQLRRPISQSRKNLSIRSQRQPTIKVLILRNIKSMFRQTIFSNNKNSSMNNQSLQQPINNNPLTVAPRALTESEQTLKRLEEMYLTLQRDIGNKMEKNRIPMAVARLWPEHSEATQLAIDLKKVLGKAILKAKQNLR